MDNSILVKLTKPWKRLLWLEPEERAIDTLTSFVRDAEHELLSVATSLQAHVDLLHDEMVRNQMPVDRFVVLNRAIARLIADTNILASVCELVKAPRSKQKQILESLMQEITQETQSAFSDSEVSLSSDISANTILTGDAGQLKMMITALVLAVLQTCYKLGTVRVIGRTVRKRVSMSFDTGLEADGDGFKPWRLGALRLIPTNGDGISLASVDAMARVHGGQLMVSTLSDKRHGYKLVFGV